jgi:hypothetical protein
MFATDAIQAALNSRRIGGGGVRFCTEITGACPQAVSKLASTKSERISTLNRGLGIAHNVNQVSVKRLLVISVALLVACKSPTPAEQMDSLQSWLATAGMVGDAWLRHTTPDKYSRQTLELSHETLLQISTDLLKSPPPAVDSTTLDTILTESQGHIAQMARLIAAKDAPDFARQLDSLRANQRVVKQLSDRIKSSQ